jgi:shikimate kinase
MKHCNIALAGFMGTGKSTVGPLVAQALGWRFVDTDAVIESRAGRSIDAMFADQGEAALRALEAEVCREVAALCHQVIALGGGTLLNDETRRLVQQHSLVIGLTCDLETVRMRVGEGAGRPLLSGDPARLAALWEARAAHYASLPQQVDTTHLTPQQAADLVLERWLQWAR